MIFSTTESQNELVQWLPNILFQFVMKVSAFNVSVVSPCQQLSRAPYLRYIPAHRALQACLRTLVGNETTINCAASCFLSTSSSHALPCGEFWVQWGEYTVPWQLWLSIVIYWKLWYGSQSPYRYSAVRKVPMKLMQKRSWSFYFRKRKTESERETTFFISAAPVRQSIFWMITSARLKFGSECSSLSLHSDQFTKETHDLFLVYLRSPHLPTSTHLT